MTLQARPAGVTLEVAEPLRGMLTLGWLEADGVGTGPLGEAFASERDQTLLRLTERHAGRPTSDIPGVAETRALFHRLGVDPTKTRPSSEALLRRVLQGKGLPEVGPAVDVCNLASLEHQFPLGLYDRERVRGGAVRVRLGRVGEGYPGIRKQHVHLTQRLLLADEEGPFGAPTSDSARTAVSAETRALLVVLFCAPERPTSALSAALERVSDLLTRYCGATIQHVRTVQ